MKQLWMMNDVVKDPKATPRTLYVVASILSACRRSRRGLGRGSGEKLVYVHSPKATALAAAHP